MLSERTLAFGQRAAAALLGVDGLYRAESGDADGLVVLDMAKPGEIEPERFDGYDDAAAAWRVLREEADELPEPDRQVYYEQLARSTLSFITWRSAHLSFKSQLADFLHVRIAPASDKELDALRDELHALLGRMGYSGDLAAQCRAWEERHRVPPAEVEAVATELMKEAWERTELFVTELPEPISDGMRVRCISGVPYNARCDYPKRTVEINTDPVLTVPGLRHLITHECYPGHYVQFKLRETAFRRGLAPADNLLSVVNTASSVVFEGIADAALEMIRWDRTDDDRVQALLTLYRAGVGTGAAWRLHGEEWPERRVEGWLRKHALIGGEGWVENRMRFIETPPRAVLVWSYWCGETAVRPLWESIGADRREEFVVWLYGRMHSARSVAMFE